MLARQPDDREEERDARSLGHDWKSEPLPTDLVVRTIFARSSMAGTIILQREQKAKVTPQVSTHVGKEQIQ